MDEEIMDEAEGDDNKNREISINLDLSIQCYEDGQYKEAITNGKKCLQMAIKNGNEDAEMNACSIIGESELALKEYKNAVSHCMRSMEIAAKKLDEVVEMKTCLALGEAQCALGNYDEALMYAWRSIDIAKDIIDESYQAKACLVFAEIYCALGKHDDVILFGKRALSIIQMTAPGNQNGDRHAEIKSCLIIAEAYRALRNFDEAIDYAWRCIDIAKETADKHVEMEACLFLTETYNALGECERENTIQCALMLHVLAKETDDKKNEMEACFVIMNTYRSLKQYKEAVQYANMYLEGVKETGNKGAEMDTCEFIVDTQLVAHNYTEMFKYGMMYADVAKEIGDKPSEIHACVLIGLASRPFESYDDVIQYATKRMTLGQETDDQGNKKIGCLLLGLVDCNLLNYDKAVSYFGKALNHAKEEGDEFGEMTICFFLGEMHMVLNQFDDAISCCERSLQIAKKIGDKQNEMNCSLKLSEFCAILNRSDEVKSYATIAKEIAKELGDKEGQIKANVLLGGYYRAKSNQDSEAIDCLKESIDISKETGDNVTELLASLLLPSSSFGDLRKQLVEEREIAQRCSLPVHENPLMINTQLETVFPVFCSLYDGLMSLTQMFSAGFKVTLKEVINCLVQDVMPQNGFQFSSQTMNNSLKKWINALPLKAEEEAAMKKILQFLTEQEQQVGIQRDSFEEILKCEIEICSIILDILKDVVNIFSFEAMLLSCLGISHYLLGDIPNAKASCEKAIRCFESVFDNLHDVDRSKISIVDKYVQIYKLLSNILIEEGNTEEALLVAERCRAKALKDILVLEYGLNKEAIQECHVKENDILPVLNVNKFSILFYTVSFSEIYKFLIEEGKVLHFSVQPLSLLDWKLKNLIRMVYVELDVRRDFRCESVSPQLICISQMMKSDEYRETNLRIGRALFEKILLENGMNPEECNWDGFDDFIEEIRNEVVSILEDPGNSKVEETCSAPPCTSSFFDVYTVEGKGSFTYTSALEALSQTLLGDVSLEQDEVVIILEGLLSIVPFAALTNPATGRYLSEDKKIRFAPSLTTLKLLSESTEDFHTLKGAIFIGDPDVSRVLYNGKPVGQLQNAEIEVTLIASKFNVTPLIGAQATKGSVLEKLHEGASVVHIAAHGDLDKATILLAPDPEVVGVPKEEDYMLTMADVQQSQVRAQLVVLSCCQSGRGEIKAEGVVGMCRAFLASGARAVVASLWAVSDEATLEFMLEFYDRLEHGESASTSLQMAMKELRDIYKEPKYWAPFFLMGDDVKITF